MIKIILLIVLLISIPTGAALYQYFNSPKKPPVKSNIPVTSTKTATSSAKQAIGSAVGLDSALVVPSSLPASSTVDEKVLFLESKLAVLQRRIELMEKNSTSQTATAITNSASTTSSSTSSSKRAWEYIWPLGKGGSTSALDWTSISTLTVTFNPSDYTGAKSFQLEAEIQQYQGNGTANARLYNSQNGTAVNGSDLSTSAENYTWISSDNFSLPGGEYPYILQLKSTTGYAASLNNFRIKVNYQ